ncbi:MAG: hypothetical protein HOQ24_08150 [Mycobacteriaceae bacterium]|nr:hypothetical protein [Mycobacteriaceae bacterium]
MKILLLIEDAARADISHAVYITMLRRLGHAVLVGDVNSLGWSDRELTVTTVEPAADVTPFGPVTGPVVRDAVVEADLVWVLNQPHTRLRTDVWQLLWRLNQRVPFVNDVVGLMMLNNKNNLPLIVPAEHLPRSLGSASHEVLAAHVERGERDRFILKRPNGGCGADVFVLSRADSNAKALLQSLTGNQHALGAMTGRQLTGLQADMAIVQEFVPHRTEKRITVCGGRVVASNEKRLAAHEHRGNVSQQARMRLAEATSAEVELAETVARRLLDYGIRFAGLDVSYPYVFEVNLVNPGGLIEPTQLGVPDPYLEPALRRLLDSCAVGRGAEEASCSVRR